MKTKTSTRALALGMFILLLGLSNMSAQGLLSISLSNPTSGDSQAIICGSNYTTLLPYEDLSNQVIIKEDTWILSNEGSETLQIQLPLSFDPSSPNYLAVSEQPQGILAPGESTNFTTTYEYKPGNDQHGFLPIISNSTVNAECGIMLGGMVETVSLCICHCTDNNILEEICPFGIEGFFGGVNVAKDLCDNQPTDSPCTNLTLLGSCTCDDYISLKDEDLFIDTLRMMGIPGTDIILTGNTVSEDYSFLNVNAVNYRVGTKLGTTDNIGNLDIPILRRPNTAIKIMVNGVNYTSQALCPDISDCVEEEEFIPGTPGHPVPTLSEWSLYILSLLILIFSLVKLRSMEKINI